MLDFTNIKEIKMKHTIFCLLSWAKALRCTMDSICEKTVL